MANTPKVDPTPLSVNQSQSTERQTPKTDFGTRMAVGASQLAGAVGSTLGIANPFVPGGAVVTAAVAGVQSTSAPAVGGAGPSQSSSGRIASNTGYAYGQPKLAPPPMGTPGTGGGALTPGGGVAGDANSQFSNQLDMMKNTNLDLLMKQSQMNHESQQYMSLSNIMKVRHDAAKNTIQNVH
jgi:hypothetical protein